MKKKVYYFIVGCLIVVGAFWISQPSTSESRIVSELPKKEYAKDQIELPKTTAWQPKSTKVSANEIIQTNATTNNTSKQQPTKRDFLYIAASFMEELVQPTDNKFNVKAFQSKQQLIQHLSQYASKDVAREYVDGLYEEKAKNLYIIPTETPPWIILNKEATLTRMNANTYQLKQKNKTSLYGMYEIQIVFTWKGGNWLIDSVTMK